MSTSVSKFETFKIEKHGTKSHPNNMTQKHMLRTQDYI